MVKVKDGNVACYDSNGVFADYLATGGAVSAAVSGDVVTVTDEDGTVKLFDANTGLFKGYL